ncbi:hypothetical protein DMENIID0001_093180 [Sergentomyia squamirostris]
MDSLNTSSRFLRPEVRRLEARFGGISSMRISKLLINCSYMENLEHLHLERFSLIPYLPLLSLVLPKIKTLKLIACELTDEIGVHLKNAYLLESLSLAQNDCIEGSFLPDLKNLHELDISRCFQINDINYLSEFCINNSNLKKLNLMENS